MLVCITGTLPRTPDTSRRLIEDYRLTLEWGDLARIEKDFFAHHQIQRSFPKGNTSVFVWAASYPIEDITILEERLGKLGDYLRANGGWYDQTRWRGINIDEERGGNFHYTVGENDEAGTLKAEVSELREKALQEA